MAMYSPVLNISKDEDSTASLGWPVLVFNHPHSENMFSLIEFTVFQFVPIACYPLTKRSQAPNHFFQEIILIHVLVEVPQCSFTAGLLLFLFCFSACPCFNQEVR